MIRCYHCGTDNLDGSEYCDECGTKLSMSPAASSQSYAPPVTQVAPPPPPSFIRDVITPKPATPYTPPPPPPPITPPPVISVASPPASPFPPPPPLSESGNAGANSPNAANAEVNRGQGIRPSATPEAREHGEPLGAGGTVFGQHTTAFNGQTSSLRGGAAGAEGGAGRQAAAPAGGAVETSIRAKLIIQRGGKVGKEFPILAAESMIGRWDADGGIFPDVDLDQDDPEAKVSRRHARIQYLNNQFLIEDLGSTNGTFLNRGPRLLPGAKQPLNNGDEIIVGKTFLKFVLV